MKLPQQQSVCGTRRVTRSMTRMTRRDPISLPIPDEIVYEIYSRLPLQSIARCRCVCKRWSSVPQLQNLEGKSYAVAANPIASFPCSLGFSGCTNGLFCYSGQWFKDYEGKSSVYENLIYNPSTGQSLTLPKLKSRMSDGIKTFLGYDPNAKEFKVLSMACPFNVRISVDHQVLTLGTERLSWRKVQCYIPHLPDHDSICFGGVLYYIAGAQGIYYNMSIAKSMVVCFDLRTEKFSSVKLMKKEKPYSPTLVNHNGKLALLMSEDSSEVIRESKSFELWVLQDAAKHEWSKHVYLLPLLWKDVVVEGMNIVGMIGTNEIVLSPWNQNGSSYVIYYNVESKMISRVGIQGMEAFQGKYPRAHLNYVENVKHL